MNKVTNRPTSLKNKVIQRQINNEVHGSYQTDSFSPCLLAGNKTIRPTHIVLARTFRQCHVILQAQLAFADLTVLSNTGDLWVYLATVWGCSLLVQAVNDKAREIESLSVIICPYPFIAWRNVPSGEGRPVEKEGYVWRNCFEIRLHRGCVRGNAFVMSFNT